MFQRISATSAVCGALALSMVFTAATACAQSDSEVVGRVGDRSVTMADLDEAWRKNDAAARIRMLQELYDTRRRTLDIVIGDILIEREAMANGVSHDELLAQELPSRTLPVTDEDTGDVATLVLDSWKEACGTRWDLNAGQAADWGCAHSVVLRVAETGNEALLSGHSYRSAGSSPLVTTAHRWHAPNARELLETFAFEIVLDEIVRQHCDAGAGENTLPHRTDRSEELYVGEVPLLVTGAGVDEVAEQRQRAWS